ncbi:hypothetical protein GGQ84_001106 [Desulfitispora alkaliphila]|uniref:YIEGIA family protein n=1 Tax=Desulfitispora alkaliphila TaxID=622674 RepID=UPI003D1E7C76
MDQTVATVIIGIAFGVFARTIMLKVDYRQYPSYPHGYITHISLGFMAAALGAVAIPAIAAEDFVAVTFLTLAAQQFRDIRNIERETLNKLDEKELIPRGTDYIEGIAKVFETRNYLVIGTSLVASLIYFVYGLPHSLIAGGLFLMFLIYAMRGQSVGDIADVEEADFKFEGAMLNVGGIIIMNVGLLEAREKLLKEAIAVKMKPKDDNARATLDDLGQRQAIVHTVANLVGTKLEEGEQEWSPLVRKNIDTGEVFLFILPNEPDVECVIEAVKSTPVLESSQRKILQSKIGRKASD